MADIKRVLISVNLGRDTARGEREKGRKRRGREGRAKGSRGRGSQLCRPSINGIAPAFAPLRGRFTAFVNQRWPGRQRREGERKREGERERGNRRVRGIMASLWHSHAWAAASRSICITCLALLD